MTAKKVRVDALRPGMQVDLEGDAFADRDPDSPWHHGYEFEYVVVEGAELETPGCLRVDFTDSPSVGFPPHHEVEVAE